MLVAETFKALGDPTRLKIIERLSSGSPYTLGTASKDLGISRQGARKHLQILADADLVTITPHGRQTTITFRPVALKQANTFIQQLENQWAERLEVLRTYVENSNK